MIIALIDGPVSVPSGERTFCCTPHPRFDQSPAAQHANAMVAAIQRAANGVRIDNYVVFPGKLGTSLDAVCRALEQVAESEATLAHCSFGLATSSPRLQSAIAALIRSGKQVVASTVARGASVFPAGYDGVIAVQGDARCDPDNWSCLDLPHAQFGACPIGGEPNLRGASIAAAHFSGLLARHKGQISQMRAMAQFQGRERILHREGAADDGV